MPKRSSIFLLLAALLMLCAHLAVAAPLGRGFTYQGQLDQSGVPVDGTATLRFSLWDAAGSGDPPAGGTMIGAVQTVTNLSITKGIFAVVLNGSDEFGAQAFNGEARWLQVEVCADSTCAATTVLGPRQAITGAPYSLGPWQMSGTSVGYNEGSVGIGTTSPELPLHIKGSHPAMKLQDTEAASQQTGYLAFWNATSEMGWVGYGSIGSPLFSVVNVRPAGDVQLYTAAGPTVVAKSTGSVGIGTSSPISKLEVRGDIRFGTTGQWLAPASTEALRIVRGEVLAAGTVNSGTGFTITHSSTGLYRIIFTTAFLAINHPTLSVTPLASSGTLIAMGNGLVGPNYVDVRIVNGSGTATDGAFSFIVIGVR